MNRDKIFNDMKQMAGNGMLKIPPNCHEFLEGDFIDYTEGESLTMTFPIYEKYNNPAGVTLGGFIPLFFDAVMGPLSYLLAKKPTTSLDLNTTFIRPITSADENIKVTASLVTMSKSYLILEGKAWNSRGKLIATSTSRMKIFDIPG